MLIYHPALDPYHSAFRMLQILAAAPERSFERRALRILDFYCVFPQLVSTIKLPREQMKWKREFADQDNAYWFTGEPRVVFAQMQPLQDTALDLLYAQGLVDPAKYAKTEVQLVVDQFKALQLPAPSSVPNNIFEFLTNVLGTISFHGPGGLKDRTDLLDYRYDA
jgi:hypothetical protein